MEVLAPELWLSLKLDHTLALKSVYASETSQDKVSHNTFRKQLKMLFFFIF